MATPNAWDDDWETAADKPSDAPRKPPSAKVTQAQRRAQQAEFNRQLWADADGPREPNYFLEARGIVPKADFKPTPRLLSRKAPSQATAQTNGDASSDDEDEDGNKRKKKPLTVEEQRALAAKEREEKQRKYRERRLELFGSATNVTTTTSNTAKPGSGTPSPADTPPGSRSSTPSRARGRGGRKINNNDGNRPLSSTSSLSLKPSSIAPPPKKELFDPNYTPRPETRGQPLRENVIEPIRSPRGPDGSGRGGFGFAPRGGKNSLPPAPAAPAT